MKKLIKVVKYGIVAVMVMVELLLVGCAMFPDVVTPCWIEPEAAKYADVNVPGLLPYTSLLDARKVDRGMNYVHLVNQITFARLLEDENLKFDFLKNAHTLHIKEGEEIQEAVFSPTGPLGILLSGGILGTMGALFVPRLAEKKKVAEAKENGKKEANGNHNSTNSVT